MKKKMLSKITAILAASFMAAIPVTSSAYAADAVITARKPANVKEVKDSGDNLRSLYNTYRHGNTINQQTRYNQAYRPIGMRNGLEENIRGKVF